jgi:hypothetical protein
MTRNRFGIVLGLIGLAVLAGILLSALLRGSADGSSGTDHVVFVSSGKGSCRIGQSAALHAPRAGGPRSLRSPVLVLACGQSRSQGRVQIVGYATTAGICVSIDNLRWRESHGGLCKPEQARWSDLCASAPACILGTSKPHGYTEISGILAPQVRGIRVESGRTVVSGSDIALAQVSGGLLARLHQAEPFGYFVVFLPGCVPPEKARVELLGGDGAALGTARPMEQLHFPCP